MTGQRTGSKSEEECLCFHGAEQGTRYQLIPAVITGAEMESEELKKNLKMCQVMHTGEPALCVFAQGVPASGVVYKTLAESV